MTLPHQAAEANLVVDRGLPEEKDLFELVIEYLTHWVNSRLL